MNKENEFNLNLSYNSRDDVPIISISNKSKSNSSNNQQPTKFSKKIKHKIDNNKNSSSFSIRHNRKKNPVKKEESSFSFNTFSQHSYIKENNVSKESKEKACENKSKTDKKQTKINLGNETPIKKSEKNKILYETFRNKKKDLLYIDNIHGKNLMQYFDKMSENIDLEENNNRVSSVGNKQKSSFKLKKTEINTNKSWNKNKNCFLNSKNPLKINNKKYKIQENNPSFIPLKKNIQPINRYNTPNIASLQNILNKNNINLDLKNLIDKNRPKKIDKKETKNTTVSTGKTNIDKRLSFEKIQNTSNSDSHKRKLSFSHLKMGETYIKNLFQDNNKKFDEMTNVNKYINTNEKKPNDKLFEKNIIFHTQLKKKTADKFLPLNKKNIRMNPNNRKQSENRNKIQKINDYYLKIKEMIEIEKNKKSGV